MTNHRKESTSEEDRRDAGKDGIPDAAADSADSGPTSGTPGTSAPILHSEDDELFDEDAPQ
ncbi:MAG TPA: hypothetical protein VF573_25575 [Paraburkholderia sp.]|uniref:hypothetical protein n=1 Tax=Paraburkholderia sp. TaxID=1926495 RepID=UPI002ED209E6